MGLAQHATERPQQLDRRVRLEVVKTVEDALQIRALILERRLLQHEVTLLHRRSEDHMPPDPRERRLRARLQRRHLDHEIATGAGATGQAPAVAQLVDGEGARVEIPDRHIARDDPHLALLAGAVAAARGVDRDPVPARGVEDRRTARDADLVALGEEAQPDPLRPVLGGRELVAQGRTASGRHGAHAA